jgi:SHS2 domain-containing protein
MPWQTFPHEADIGVRGTGATLEEAFAGAALALTIDCEAPDLELLLIDWLNALIYRMATRHLLFSRYEVKINGTRLHATAWGEAVDVTRHQPAAEAKGVSFCELKVARQADGSWLAQAVVDV